MKEYIIDGSNVASLKDFEWELIFMLRQNINTELANEEGIKTTRDGVMSNKSDSADDGNLDSINDYIHELSENCSKVILYIINSDHIRDVLGYDAWEKRKQVRYDAHLLELDKKNPEHAFFLKREEIELSSAKAKKGPTLFSYLIEMILENPKILLRLE